ncbi:DUF1176 domain-containing protein [Methylocella tundrae]|nr:DUF1176 domain-containing protein [Methylocella tundrae]
MKHSLSLYSFFGMLGLSFAAAGSAAAQSKSADGPTIKSNPAAQAQSLKQFKDWTIGCDNLRTCTALGLLPDQNAGAYVKVSRTGAGDDQPVVAFTVDAENPAKAPQLKVLLDGMTGPGLPSKPLPARQDGDFVTATLTGDGARAFLEALRPAKTLTVQLIDGASTGDPAIISLAGSAAALLYMDAQQNRLGTVTALVQRGSAPASSVPAAPAPPSIAAITMSEIKTAPKRPAGIHLSKDESCKDYDPIVVRLSPDQTLWGVCEQAAAYNFRYRFWIADAGRATLAAFKIPGKSDADPAELVSPYLLEDGLTLGAEDKGRGVGDCGEISEWAWDGAAFQLIRFRQMNECRGVSSNDWPALYTAKAARAR